MIYKERCKDCAYLVEVGYGIWFCEQFDKPCEDIKKCEVGTISNTLTKEQMAELREDIVLGSIYTNDYENRFNIDSVKVQLFFDGFIDDCWDLADYEDRNIKDVEGIYAAYDDIDHIYDYYCSVEYPFGMN